MNVRFWLNTWFVTTEFFVHVGVDITIKGPPMAGNAHIDLIIINFTIVFDALPPKLKQLSVRDFGALVK